MTAVRSLKTRISLINVAVLAVTMVAYTGVLYGLMDRFMTRSADRELTEKSREIADLMNSLLKQSSGAMVTTMSTASNTVIMHRRLSYRETADDALMRRVLQTVDRYELRDDYTALLAQDGEMVAFSDNMSPDLLERFSREAASAAGTDKPVRRTLTVDGKTLRLHGARQRLADGRDYTILIAESLKEDQRAILTMLLVCLGMIPPVLVIGAFAGRVLAGRVLKPVAELAGMADRITHEGLDLRVSTPNADEEIGRLVRSFNGMIDRLEKSFAHISEFSAHAAHELKTPLAVVRGEAEVALRRERTPEEYREALEANLREVKRMVRVVDDLLLITRLDHPSGTSHFEPMPLAPFLGDIAEKARILAEAKKISVDFVPPSGSARISADETSLRRLFMNLLDNALKFTPEGGRIGIRAGIEGRRASVRVSDSGPGIPEAERTRIFDKFYRVAGSGDLSAGNGLGLSIADSVAKAHRGTVRALAGPDGGAVFEVILPLI